MELDRITLNYIAKELEATWGDGIVAELNSRWEHSSKDKGLKEALSVLADTTTVAMALYYLQGEINKFLIKIEDNSKTELEIWNKLKEHLYNKFVKEAGETAGRIQIIVEVILKHLKDKIF